MFFPEDIDADSKGNRMKKEGSVVQLDEHCPFFDHLGNKNDHLGTISREKYVNMLS